MPACASVLYIRWKTLTYALGTLYTFQARWHTLAYGEAETFYYKHAYNLIKCLTISAVRIRTSASMVNTIKYSIAQAEYARGTPDGYRTHELAFHRIFVRMKIISLIFIRFSYVSL
jgi:hypothetical protein